jgi:hypothetical protein
MAQIVAFPRTLSFTRAFEELPLFTQRAQSGDLFCGGLINGSIEISFTPGSDWWISDLHIAVENARRCGDDAPGKLVNLDPDESPSLYWLALDVFTDKYADTIKEWVREAAAEAGLPWEGRMTLQQRDREVAHYLHVIERTGREVVTLTEQMGQAVRDLQSRPGWLTVAADELERAERQALATLERIRNARARYAALPVVE